MVTFEDARQLILSSIAPLASERVELFKSLKRVLAANVVAPRDMPRCDNSAMDGYAVRACDCRESAMLDVTGYIPAGGAATMALEPGRAVKIMTGAPLPPGCDAVVPFEQTEETNGRIRIKEEIFVRQHIRFTGEDVRCGEIIVPAGTVIRPPVISMLATFGQTSVPVYRQPQVAILSTGDELIQVGKPLVPGKIFDSNSLYLAAAIEEIGAVPLPLGIARDDVANHRTKLAEGLEADALVTSAGVSAGDRDLVREVLEQLGVKPVFWRVNMKPGGPTAFGTKDGKPVFSLPGNPTATIITFEEFVRPALLKLMGHTRVLKPLVKAVLQHDVRKKPGNIKFLRVRLKSENGRYLAYSSGDQNTGMLKTTLLADAIAMLPAGRTSFAAGDEVDVHILRNDWNFGLLPSFAVFIPVK
jgi:molybdopterin molybdotransferase